MSNIEDLKKKVQSLEDQLSAAKASLHAAMIEAYPIKQGMVIRDMGYWKSGKEYLVAELSVRYGEVRIIANKRLKSGKFHKNAFEESSSKWEIVSDTVSR